LHTELVIFSFKKTQIHPKHIGIEAVESFGESLAESN
jgi:hypothetical protein